MRKEMSIKDLDAQIVEALLEGGEEALAPIKACGLVRKLFHHGQTRWVPSFSSEAINAYNEIKFKNATIPEKTATVHAMAEALTWVTKKLDGVHWTSRLTIKDPPRSAPWSWVSGLSFGLLHEEAKTRELMGLLENFDVEVCYLPLGAFLYPAYVYAWSQAPKYFMAKMRNNTRTNLRSRNLSGKSFSIDPKWEHIPFSSAIWELEKDLLAQAQKRTLRDLSVLEVKVELTYLGAAEKVIARFENIHGEIPLAKSIRTPDFIAFADSIPAEVSSKGNTIVLDILFSMYIEASEEMREVLDFAAGKWGISVIEDEYMFPFSCQNLSYLRTYLHDYKKPHWQRFVLSEFFCLPGLAANHCSNFPTESRDRITNFYLAHVFWKKVFSGAPLSAEDPPPFNSDLYWVLGDFIFEEMESDAIQFWEACAACHLSPVAFEAMKGAVRFADAQQKLPEWLHIMATQFSQGVFSPACYEKMSPVAAMGFQVLLHQAKGDPSDAAKSLASLLEEKKKALLEDQEGFDKPSLELCFIAIMLNFPFFVLEPLQSSEEKERMFRIILDLLEKKDVLQVALLHASTPPYWRASSIEAKLRPAFCLDEKTNARIFDCLLSLVCRHDGVPEKTAVLQNLLRKISQSATQIPKGQGLLLFFPEAIAALFEFGASLAAIDFHSYGLLDIPLQARVVTCFRAASGRPLDRETVALVLGYNIENRATCDLPSNLVQAIQRKKRRYVRRILDLLASYRASIQASSKRIHWTLPVDFIGRLARLESTGLALLERCIAWEKAFFAKNGFYQDRYGADHSAEVLLERGTREAISYLLRHVKPSSSLEMTELLALLNNYDARYDHLSPREMKRQVSMSRYTGLLEDYTGAYTDDAETKKIVLHILDVCAACNLSREEAADYLSWCFEEAAKASVDKMIPVVKIELGRITARTLKPLDPLGPLLGILTGCCQHLKGAAGNTARHGFSSPYGGFMVVEVDGEIKAQSHLWTDGDSLVMDSFEGARIDRADIEAAVIRWVCLMGDHFERIYGGDGFTEEFSVKCMSASYKAQTGENAEDCPLHLRFGRTVENPVEPEGDFYRNDSRYVRLLHTAWAKK